MPGFLIGSTLAREPVVPFSSQISDPTTTTFVRSGSFVVDVTDRVVALLASTVFTVDIEPANIRRVYVPKYDPGYAADGSPLEPNADPPLVISVVPARLDSTLLDRAGREAKVFELDIGIQKQFGAGALPDEQIKQQADLLLALAEDIAELFVGVRFETVPPARCVSSKNQPIYVPDHMEENRVFTSVVRATFRASG